MPKQNDEKQRHLDNEGVSKNLPPGVKLRRTLLGQTEVINRVAWSPDGRWLASPSDDGAILLLDAETGECLSTLKGHMASVCSTAFHPTGALLASGSVDGTIKIWDPNERWGCLLRTLQGHKNRVTDVKFDPEGRFLASGSGDQTINLWDAKSGYLRQTLKGRTGPILCIALAPSGGLLASSGFDHSICLWDTTSGRLLRTLEGHSGRVCSLAFHPTSGQLASGSDDNTIKLWNVDRGCLLKTLEGHTDFVTAVNFDCHGFILASRSRDHSIRLWRCSDWTLITQFSALAQSWMVNIPFHPTLPRMVSTGPRRPYSGYHPVELNIYELDLDLLLDQPAKPSVTYTSAKIVLVGDSGVGKTGLGWRMAHGEFKEHASTHGQQFWLLEQLRQKRADGTECEAVLWDLAGQPDYRIIHALFLDDADLALVLFDPTKEGDPLSGVEYWLRQLKAGKPAASGPRILLVAARKDRGTPHLTIEELEDFCRQRSLAGYRATSAMKGEGIEDLLERMKSLVPWDLKPATVTTETFKRIKDYVLELKETVGKEKVILAPEELRERLTKAEKKWQFTDDEMLTAVGHLSTHGYVTKLKTSKGESRLLLSPELLNNLAASLVLEARRNVRGLGALEEQKLLSGQYPFPELEKLTPAERDLLLDAATALFLEHNVCFRGTNPHNRQTYLVFPELIHLKRPTDANEKPVEDGAGYTVSGAIENVYASLVVLMGYTQTFTRTSQWRNQARYEVGNQEVCGFRLEEERPGELDLVLYFSTDTAAHVRTLFQSLFEGFLARRSHLEVKRFDPVQCSKSHRLNRAVVREQLTAGDTVAFCGRCGEKVNLPNGDGAIHLTAPQARELEVNQRVACDRTRFEQVLFRLKTYVKDEKLPTPECFISYAWGDRTVEHWVEKSLATDLQKAGIKVLLDVWHNTPGSDIQRFVDRLEKVDRIVVVGTEVYRRKYENQDPDAGTVVAAECTQINLRMRGPEKQKSTVVPVLRDGTSATALPPSLRNQVFCDFRKDENYFTAAFALLLSLYDIAPNHAVAQELKDSLQQNVGRSARLDNS